MSRFSIVNQILFNFLRNIIYLLFEIVIYSMLSTHIGIADVKEEKKWNKCNIKIHYACRSIANFVQYFDYMIYFASKRSS